MNLASLRALVDNLVDYDPVNETYREDIATLLNEAQKRVLGDQAWDFLIEEARQRVLTDVTTTMTFTSSSPDVTGSGFPLSTDLVNPGSVWELGIIDVTDSAGTRGFYQIRHVSGTGLLYLDRPFTGVTGAYSVTVRFRNIYLPPDTTQLQGELRTDNGTPIKLTWLSQFSHDSYDLDPDLLGTPENVLEGEAIYVPAPRSVRGVATPATGLSQGNRTITIYMVNVLCPAFPGFDTYPGYSGGFESALSPGTTYTLSPSQIVELTPEAIDETSGFYRRYYFTCPDEGVYAPRRLRQATTGGLLVAGQDTIDPKGGITLTPSTSQSFIQSQNLDTSTVRYQPTMGGSFRALQLYPHPSSDQDIIVRRLKAPAQMYEDQDFSSIPPQSAQIIAFEALADIANKLDQPALATSFQRRADTIFRGMQQRYISKPSRRIVRGASPAVYPTMFGPLTFT